jgi:hypothetical protein
VYCVAEARKVPVEAVKVPVEAVRVLHSGTEVVLVREGPRAGVGSSQRKKGSDYFTSPVKTMTLRDIK